MVYKHIMTPLTLVLSFSLGIFYINSSYAGGNDRDLAPVEMLDSIKGKSKSPVVEPKVILEAPPVVRKDKKLSKPDLSERPVGYPTGPVEDVGEKIYKNCDELSASNSAYKYTCIFLLGVFSIL